MRTHTLRNILRQSHVDAYELMIETWEALAQDFSNVFSDAVHDDSCPATMELMDLYDAYTEVSIPLTKNLKYFRQTAHAILDDPTDEDFNKLFALIDICHDLGQELLSVLLDGMNGLKPYANDYDFSAIANVVRQLKQFVEIMDDGFTKTRDGIGAVLNGK